MPPSDGDYDPLEESGGERQQPGRPAASAGMTEEDMVAFRRFQRFLRMEQGPNPSPRRGRRGRDEEDEDDGYGDKGQAGPPPSWDGSSSFEDFLIRARLWLATTKAKGKARGPLLLKALSGTPFETFKHLAKDAAWLADANNANVLLETMDKPEYYGDDQQEHMLTALSRITYHVKRQKNEPWRDFFARWEGAMRKVNQHRINLPLDYEGFLMINGLQLSETDTKALLNFTRGCIKPSSIKDWLRKNETRLAASELGAEKAKVNKVYFTEDVLEKEPYDEIGDEVDQEIETLENYLNELQDGEEIEERDVLEEEDAAEILAVMLKQKKTYKESLREKKEKELSRGYGMPGKGSKGFGKSLGKGRSFMQPGQYKVSIEEIKRRTKCNNCGTLGHWKRECPMITKSSNAKVNDTHLLESLEEMEEAVFLGMLEHHRAEDDLSEPEVEMSQFSDRSVGDLEGLPPREAYKVELGPESEGEVFELFMFENHLCRLVQKQTIDDTTCATVDTGCQRLAIGNTTLKKYAMKLPTELHVTLHSETNRFKSVHNVSTTSKVATVPSSLGPKGTFLRPAVFEDPVSHQAPFLISLTFLMHCNSTLGLDEESGLYLMFRDSNTRIPLHLGPSNALRVPLQLFEPNKIEKLRQVQGLLHQGREFEVLALTQNFCSRTVDSTPPIVHPEKSHGVNAQACSIHHLGPREAGRVESHGEEDDGADDSSQSSDGTGIAPTHRQPQEDDDRPGGEDGDGGLDPCPGVDRGADPEASSLPRSTGLRGLHHHDGLGRGRGDRAYINDFKDTNDSGDGNFQDFDNETRCTSSQQFAGSQRSFDPGINGHQWSGKSGGCERPGDRLRLHPTMPLRTSSPTSSEPHREEFREVLPEVPPRHRSAVQLLPVDHGTAISGCDSLEVQGSGRRSSTCGRSSAGHCPERLPAQEHDQAGIQRGSGTSDLQDVRQAPVSQAPQGDQGEKEQPIDWNHCRLRGVPEFPRMEETAEEMRDDRKPLSDKQVRKIRAALKQAVGFWRQIQAMLTGHGTEDTEVSKIMRQTNAEICRELYFRPEGTKRSRQLAEIMGLSHQQLKTVAEVFNPGCFSKQALKHQLIPGRVFDIELGSDLRQKERQQEVFRYLKCVRPGLVTIAPPCKLFSQLQNLSMKKRCRSKELMQKYLEDKKEAMELLEFAIAVCLLCQELGLKFVIEHPFTATSWQTPAMQKLLGNPLFYFFSC